MSMDAQDLKQLEKEFLKEGVLKAYPDLYYDCETCGDYHERGDGCEWQEHPSNTPTIQQGGK